MKSLDQLRRWRDTLRSTVAKMEPEKARFLAEKARIEADATRHPDYVREKVGEARDKSLATFGTPIAEVRNLARVVADEAIAWRSVPYLLSQAVFDKSNAAAENSTRQRWFAELSNMPAGLFALTVADLKRSGNLAGLYQAYLVGHAKHGESGWRGVDLSDVVVPDQREALDIITECSTFPTAADQVVGEVSGRLNANPLAVARALQPAALQPTMSFDDDPKPVQKMPEATHIDPTMLPTDRLAQHRTAA